MEEEQSEQSFIRKSFPFLPLPPPPPSPKQRFMCFPLALEVSLQLSFLDYHFIVYVDIILLKFLKRYSLSIHIKI